MDSKAIKIPFFRLGQWRHPVYGNLEVTQEKMDAMKSNFQRNVLGQPPFVRLGHSKGGGMTWADTPAEAWIYDLVQEGPVLYALAHPTSDELVEAIKSKRYRFASAEYDDNYTNKETGQKVGATLTAIGLTNEPFLTRLPETVALADNPDDIYLDYEEVKRMDKPENTLIKKLSDAIDRFADLFRQMPTAVALSDEDRQKLAAVDEIKVQLAANQEQLKLATEQAAAANQTAWAAQVDNRLNALVAQGIPPAMTEPVKAILLANPAAGTTMIKLADNKEISLADQMYAALEALPKEHRIDMSQRGRQEDTKPDSPEAMKKLADEDVAALGGKVTENGKYIL